MGSMGGREMTHRESVPSHLSALLESTRARVRSLPPIDDLRAQALEAPDVRPFVQGLAKDGLSVIAEVKRRSPSRGDLAMDLDPVERAGRYAEGGADALSVLTEPDHFAGSEGDLRAIRAAVPVPVLRKDFILEPAQVWESRAMGADALLLIVAAVDPGLLRDLHDLAGEAGIAALVEIHSESEAETALAIEAPIVGVNTRNLRTFEVDLAVAERLAPMLASTHVTVAESGISRPEHAKRMADAGYSAVLIGESLVTADDPAAMIRSFVS